MDGYSSGSKNRNMLLKYNQYGLRRKKKSKFSSQSKLLMIWWVAKSRAGVSLVKKSRVRFSGTRRITSMIAFRRQCNIDSIQILTVFFRAQARLISGSRKTIPCLRIIMCMKYNVFLLFFLNFPAPNNGFQKNIYIYICTIYSPLKRLWPKYLKYNFFLQHLRPLTLSLKKSL